MLCVGGILATATTEANRLARVDDHQSTMGVMFDDITSSFPLSRPITS
jgi:hypothetical protein